MSTIEMTQELYESLRIRMQKEFGDQCAVTFLLEIINQNLQTEIVNLKQQNEILIEKINQLGEIVEQQRVELGGRPRKNRMKGIDVED